jgi:hypothetical protein
MKSNNQTRISLPRGEFGQGLFSVAAVTMMFAYACVSSADTRVRTERELVSVSQYKVIHGDLVTISFKEGSAALSDESMKAISDFAKNAKGQSTVDSYIVASWADRDYPAKGELSIGQRQLADSRSTNIKRALSASTSETIDTFQMTKQPNWIQRVFSTDAAELKGQDVDSKKNPSLMKDIGKRLQDSGGPRTAVIVAKFRNEVSTN